MFLTIESSLQLVMLIDQDVSKWSDYLDYPGAEVWKFVNLFIFIAFGIYLLRRPLADALRSRREGIKRDLLIARKERDEAHAQLAEVQARLEGLDAEVSAIRDRSRAEAAAEAERMRSATEAEIAKLREQAQREIESASKAARHELRRFAAEQSVRIAEAVVRREIRPEDDARLIDISVRELGRRAH